MHGLRWTAIWIAAAAGLWLLDQLLLKAEEWGLLRGWSFYRRKDRSLDARRPERPSRLPDDGRPSR